MGRTGSTEKPSAGRPRRDRHATARRTIRGGFAGLSLLLFFLGLASWHPPALGQEPSKTDVFDQIFGKRQRTVREQELAVPVILDERRRAQNQVRMGASAESVRILFSQIDALLEPALLPELRERLGTKVDGEGYVGIQDLVDLGLEARFDMQELTLHVNVPSQIRRIEVISLRGGAPLRDGHTEVTPPDLSAYLNVRSAVDYVGTHNASAARGRQPARFELDGALNYRDWVVEGDLAYAESADHFWQRGEVRLVRDFPEDALRFEGGDLTMPVSGFQSRIQLAGLQFGTNFDLQPYRVVEPAGSTQFVIETPSKVEVFVNGRLVRTLRLVPGRYDIRDFRFGNGLNDVQVRIENNVGRVRILDFGFAFEANLLSAGTTEYSLSLGFPRQVEDAVVTYQNELATFSAFGRRGLSDTLTLGLNTQGSVDQLMVGAEAAAATPVGTLQLDAAYSLSDRTRDGYATRLRYDYYDGSAANTARRRWVLALSSQSRRFAPLGSIAPDNATSMNIAAGLSQDLFSRTTRLTLNGIYEIGRGSEPDTTTISLGLRRRIGYGFELDWTLDREWSSDGARDLNSFVTLTWVGSRSYSARATHDTSGHSTQIELQYTPDLIVGGLSAAARVNRQPFQHGYGATLQYLGPRAEIDLLHDSSHATAVGGLDEQRTGLRLGTAIAYAGGRFGLSRPITNSFALVVPHPSLRGNTIGVDRIGSQSGSQIDRLGPAVVPNLIPYQVRPVTIEAANLPPGIDIGESYFQAVPTYKSGVVIAVGTDATVVASGVLLYPNGDPVALQGGALVSVDDPGADDILIFTNRNGKFRCAGIKPGHYEIEMYAVRHVRIGFVIPAGVIGRYNLGKIPLPEGSVDR